MVALDVAVRTAFNARYAEARERIRVIYDVPTPGRDTLFDWTIEDDRPVFEGVGPEVLERMLAEVALRPENIPRP